MPYLTCDSNRTTPLGKPIPTHEDATNCLEDPSLSPQSDSKLPRDSRPSVQTDTMPFPYTLPTTSHLSFQSHYASSTHPSLLCTATSYRSVLRSALKKHKRLHAGSQSGNLPIILSAINDYLPYLLAIDAGLSGRRVAGEEVDIVLNSEISVEWRPTLSASQIPGREVSRVKGLGLDYELSFVIHTLAILNVLLAREQLSILYSEPLPTTEQRVSAIQNASKNILAANSLHIFLAHRSTSSSDPPSIPPSAVDINPTTQIALSSLTLAESTLLFVLKDDPYPSLTIQSRSKTDKEWMIKAPDIPKVRAHLFARLSLAAADHASKAAASLSSFSSSSSHKLTPELLRYAEDLRRVSRAKACRFLGLDADLSGETGKGIAWLRGGLNELGLPSLFSSSSSSASSSSSSVSSKFKSLTTTLQQQHRSPNPTDDPASKTEESLTISLLEKKWTKMNDTINVQLIPDPKSLLPSMPSGRDVHSPQAYRPVALEASEVARLRAPPPVVSGAEEFERQDEIGRRLGGLGLRTGAGDDSSDEDADADADHGAVGSAGKGGGRGGRGGVVGAFPGTRDQYSSSTGAGDREGGGGGDSGSGAGYY